MGPQGASYFDPTNNTAFSRGDGILFFTSIDEDTNFCSPPLLARSTFTPTHKLIDTRLIECEASLSHP